MIFRIVAFGVLFAFASYLYYALVMPLQGLWPRVLAGGLLFILFAVILWVPLVLWQRDERALSVLEAGMLWVAFGGMGLLSFALVLSAMRDVASFLVSQSLHTPLASGVIVASSFVLFFVGVYQAQFGVRTKTVEVPVHGLPSELSGLRIVQISDTHVSATIGRVFMEKAVQLANSLEPDMIVFTGDVADGYVRDLAPGVEPLRSLRARLGKFYISGNHEYYWEGQGWINKMKELGFTELNNDFRVVQEKGRSLVVAGIPDPTAAAFGAKGPDFSKVLAGAPAEASPRILLAHQPKFAESAAKAGFDLQISGHTHGGQFVPWIFVAMLVHRYNTGLHALGQMAIYVSRGTGYWGPPVRLGSPPEVTLLVLRPAAGGAS